MKEGISFVDYSNPDNLPELTDADISFGSAFKFMIVSDQIPEPDNKWRDLFNKLFYGHYKSNEEIVFDTREELSFDQNMKYHRFVASVMRSFSPKHEHKEKFVAHIFSIWLTGYEVVSKEEAQAVRDEIKEKYGKEM